MKASGVIAVSDRLAAKFFGQFCFALTEQPIQSEVNQLSAHRLRVTHSFVSIFASPYFSSGSQQKHFVLRTISYH